MIVYSINPSIIFIKEKSKIRRMTMTDTMAPYRLVYDALDQIMCLNSSLDLEKIPSCRPPSH